MLVLLTQVSSVQHRAAVIGALVSALLVVIRQVVVIADIGRLVDELDAKGEELHHLPAERDRFAVALRHEATHDRSPAWPTVHCWGSASMRRSRASACCLAASH